MRVLVISDIHGNLTALDAVLADAGAGYDAAWCLGDLVGYGPDPNGCIERVRALPGLQCLVGNHDKAALGEIDLSAFNADARFAVRWTQAMLAPDSQAYLAALPETLEIGKYTLVHGSPRQPVWEYILDRATATQNFPYFATPYCLVGHTHNQVVFTQVSETELCDEKRPRPGERLHLNRSRRIFNPGSVGQPRDGNPAAAYALVDLEASVWEARRVPYDVGETQARLEAEGFPERLIARLAHGW
jgi:diadenosine tetraphosphatase ApaH/serine/threonine PP2A family protein phosphatase